MFHPWVRKIPLEKGMATHSSILAWRIPWTDVGYSPGGHKGSGKTERLTLHSCFTMLCYFILYGKVNQLYVYIYPFFCGFLEGLMFDQREGRGTARAQTERGQAVVCLSHKEVEMDGSDWTRGERQQLSEVREVQGRDRICPAFKGSGDCSVLNGL